MTRALRRLAGVVLFPTALMAIISLATLATFWVVQPRVVKAANITVDSTADDTIDNGNCTLREAIISANTDTAVDACPAGSGADAITIPVGAYTLSVTGSGEDAAFTGDLDITDDLIIHGDGAANTIIDGSGLDRVFHILPTNTVEAAGLTIRNGNSGFFPGGGLENTGGGILNQGTLMLTDSIVRTNTAPQIGGGIFNVNGVLTVTNSTVSGNTAGGHGGSPSGGGIGNTGTLVSINSTISGNSANVSGGGISTSGTATLKDSKVFGNTAHSGGGIFNQGMLTLTSSALSGNTARSEGGGIRNLSGTVNVTDSTVRANTAGVNGGGILNGGAFTLVRSTVIDNATDGSGGGFHHTSATGVLTIQSSTVSGNRAFAVGGGVYDAFGSVTLVNATVAGNSATTGGGIFNGSPMNFGTVTFKNTAIAHSSTGGDCSGGGSFTSLGHNLDSDNTCNLTEPTDLPNTDPLLGPLQDNGGPTETHALLPGSPVIDHIPAADCIDVGGNPITTDQRGVTRPQGSGCDIGAYEAEQAPNQSPVADAGPDQTVECTSPAGATATLDGSGSSDPDGTPLTFFWSASGVTFDTTGSKPTAAFPLGMTTTTLTVTDPGGLSDTDTVDITVADTTPPTLGATASQAFLWPPNHKYVPINLTVIADDICDSSPTITAVAQSSEPDDAPGNGDGHTTGDIKVTSADGGVLVSSNGSPEAAFDPVNDQLELRAERAGGGGGRTYAIIVTATDASGSQATATTTVVVRHDQGGRS